jgi:cytochrome c biogenesis protein CcmG/thiol:disulfide interchange protein DsbE
MSEEKKPTSIWGKVLAWLLLVALLALVAIQLRASQQGVLTRGEPAPQFTLTTFDGQTIGPDQMDGKVVVVNIWASWCKPCEQEAEHLQRAWELYEDRGDVLFLGLAYVDVEKESLAYLDRFSITYPNGPDLGTNIFVAFRAQGVPETFVINKLGEVAAVKIGPFTSLDELTAMVDRLLE